MEIVVGLARLCHGDAGFTVALHAHTPGEVMLGAYRTAFTNDRKVTVYQAPG